MAGDEKFFTLPVGPSNVMFMLDVSGSMNSIPQCGDANDWANGALSTCKWPAAFSSLATPAVGTAAAVGTCSVPVASEPNLAWMANYNPTAHALVDAGRGTAANGLVDAPPWGTGCTGNNCLFQPGQVYAYNSWTETSATPTANPCSVTLTTPQNTTCSGTNLVTSPGTTITFTLPNCSACLTNAGAPGFYFYTYTYSYHKANRYRSGTWHCDDGVGTATATQGVYFSGGWLNANPPKFMSARKVIKDTAFIDPGATASTDQLRIGLSYMSNASTGMGCPVSISNGAAIVVPVGPSQANSYPPNSSAYVAARQLILDALNHTNGGAAGWPTGITLPSLTCGGTPMATGLFHIGEYFTQYPLVYTPAFGSSYELSSFKQSSAGLMNAPWVSSSTTTFCWACQKSAIIIVTDGSPNSEMTFPAVFTGTSPYDQNVYTLATNCGAGSATSCSGSTASKCCSPSDGTSATPSKVPRVAAWLHEHDLSPSALNGTQNLAISAVSFHLPAGNAQTILQATANMGGGMYNNAADGQALAAGVAQAVAQVSSAATSFGAPAATALTTINAVDTKAFITRFKPNQKATWEGHLFEWMLFDEAAAGCDPTKKSSDPPQQVVCRGKTVSANFDGEFTADGYNVCNKSFLVDADCDEVYEDSATGNWYKKGTGSPGQPAAKFWDAGEVLSSADHRPDTAPRPSPTTSGTSPPTPSTRRTARRATSGRPSPTAPWWRWRPRTPTSSPRT